jgi:hypothetical protein
MPTKLSAPLITASSEITTMFSNECLRLRSIRGSGVQDRNSSMISFFSSLSRIVPPGAGLRAPETITPSDPTPLPYAKRSKSHRF